jgi:hypothetical protein
MKPKAPLELFPSGVTFDLPAYVAPADVYTSARNMRVTGAGMARVGGTAEYLQDVGTGVLFAPKFVASVSVLGEIWTLYAGTAGVAVCNGLQHYNVTPAGWGDFAAGTMTSAIYNGVLCFNSPGRAPWYWDGTTAAGAVKPLPGFLVGTTARVLAAYSGFLVAGSLIAGVAEGDGRVAWSDAAVYGAVPSTWIPTVTNFAGELTLSTGSGRIMAMRPLASGLAVYRVVGSFMVQAVGRPYVLTARKTAANVGAASTNCVADALGMHAIVTTGDIVLSDGTNVRSIGDKRVKSHIFSQVSERGLEVAHVVTLPNKGEILFCFPQGQDDSCNVAYAWNYIDDKWGIRDLPNVTHSHATFVPELLPASTWDSDAGVWDDDFISWDSTPRGGFYERAVCASDAAGRLYVFDEGDLYADGQPVAGELERLSMPIGDSSAVKFVDRVWPRIVGTQGQTILIQIGGQIDASDSITWAQEQPYTIGSSDGVCCSVMGRFISIRLRAQTEEPWTVAGWQLRVRERGQF